MKFKKPPQILLKLIFYFSLKKKFFFKICVGPGETFFLSKSSNLQSVIYPRGFSKLQKLSFIVAYFNKNLIFSHTHTQNFFSLCRWCIFSLLQNRCNLPIKGRSVHNKKKKLQNLCQNIHCGNTNLKTVNIISPKKKISSWETFTNFSLSLSLSSLCVIYPRGFSTAAQKKKKNLCSHSFIVAQ
jgi:hypothetical protein